MDYADALQREGQFDETTRKAWEDAYHEWVEVFGQMRFQTGDCEVYLEASASPSAMEQIAAASGKDLKHVEREVDFYQNVSNYRFWRTKAHAERQLNTTRMHSDLFEGEALFKKGDIDAAQEVLNTGLDRFKVMLTTYTDLATDDNTLEEGLWGIMLWQKIYQLKNQVQPDEFPLKELWEKEIGRIPAIQQDFNRKYGSS